MLKKSNLRKYLRSYAEPEASVVPPLGKAYRAAIVVPACGETHEFLDAWQTRLPTSEALPALVVLVVNGDNQTAAVYTNANERLMEQVLSRGAVRLNSATPMYLVTYNGFDLLLINRSQTPHLLPDKCGVGLARKIGGDVVCAWHERGVIVGPWWMSTDADVVLPADMVQQLCGISAAAGVTCLSFEHVAGDDERVTAATFAVEIELRYHALGLAYAGSNYAWPALGSCLAIHTDTYASVRGFPKRQAGEDHYLLQKISKLAPVQFSTGLPVQICARRSARTPFGTGRSVEELLQNNPLILTLRDPECYAWLGRVIAELDALSVAGDWTAFGRWLEHGVQAALPVAPVLERIGALKNWQHTCTLSLSPQTRKRRLHEWFDGLRQIQFLRGLETVLPPLNVDQALRQAPFAPDVIADHDQGRTMVENVWFAVVQGLRRLQGGQARERRPFGV